MFESLDMVKPNLLVKNLKFIEAGVSHHMSPIKALKTRRGDKGEEDWKSKF